MMKKSLSILMLLLFSVTVSAQTMLMKITIKDGESLQKNADGSYQIVASKVSGITFEPQPLPAALKPVDLGLPSGIKWATVNYGVENPWDAYCWCEWPNEDIVYNNWGKPHDKKWRMPTLEDMEELIGSCSWAWGDLNGVRGMWVTHTDDVQKPDNDKRRIFLPVTGQRKSLSNSLLYKSKGYYWTHSKWDDKSAYYLLLDEDNPVGDLPYGGLGTTGYSLAIRPVWDDNMNKVEVSSSANNVENHSATITITINNPSGEVINEKGVKYTAKSASDWKTQVASANECTITNLDADTEYRYYAYIKLSNGDEIKGNETTFRTKESPVTITASHSDVTFESATISVEIQGEDLDESSISEWGIYFSANSSDVQNHVTKCILRGEKNATNKTIVIDTLSESTKYHYRAYVRLSGKEPRYSNVRSIETPAKPVESMMKAVDLGLSVKWASMNLGADVESGDYAGGYYGWADTTGVNHSIYNYDYGGTNTQTNIAGGEWDLATRRLGKMWQTPTRQQWKELEEKCNWKYVEKFEGRNDNGYKVSNKQDSTAYIFLPCCGFRYGEEYKYPSYCDYRTSEMIGPSEVYTIHVQGDTSSIFLDNNKVVACLGFPIRPVYTEVVQVETDERVVDLGLSVYWAKANLGASKPSDYGDYYEWGATSPYALPLTKPYYETLLEPSWTLPPSADAAFAKLGEGWRMPTYDEMYELFDNCDRKEWTTYDDSGIFGCRIYKVVNGVEQSIFLPAAGNKRESFTEFDSTTGRYWTSTSYDKKEKGDRMTLSLGLNFQESIDSWTIFGYDRTLGFTIRPVKDKVIK